MNKIGFTEDDAKASRRQYTKVNRDVWKELGFRALTAKVHDLDRELVLAEIEVRKFQRMVDLAEIDTLELNLARTLGMRNMARAPSKKERAKIREDAENSKAKGEIIHFMDQCTYYLKKFNGINSTFDSEAPYDKQTRMQAKGVSYNNLAVAYYKLGVVRLEHAEKTSVFGLTNTLVGD